MIQKILTVPNPILRHKTKPVQKIDKKILGIIKDLKDTLLVQKNPKGGGLSAPQIGKPWRIFVLSQEKKVLSFINPEIIWHSKETLAEVLPKERQFMEGCLSVPGYWGFVNRPAKVRISYLNELGQEKIQEFENLKTSYIYHETDHLDGILFIDRILKQKGKLYQLAKNQENKEVFQEVNLQ